MSVAIPIKYPGNIDRLRAIFGSDEIDRYLADGTLVKEFEQTGVHNVNNSKK